MKFTIEIDDFRVDEDSQDLATELKNSIISEMICKIKQSIEDKIEGISKNYLITKIDEYIEKGINSKINEIVEESKIKYDTGDVPEDEDGFCNIIDVVKFRVGESYRHSHFEGVIKNFAEKFGQEFKDRYDLMFASQIVNKLSENGLLKENALKALIQE